MKVGNLRVFSPFCGLAQPTIGPLWYITWIPQCGCMALLGGVLVFMTLSIQNNDSMKYTAWGLIGLEVLLYWMLAFSQPGIPKQILRKAAEIDSGESTLNNEEPGAYLTNKNDKNGADEEWQQAENINLNETKA